MAKAKAEGARDRLSIDMVPELHRKIKIFAALHGQTIREYVLESIEERLQHEKENRDLSALTADISKDTALKELWDNDKDAAYDNL